MNNTNNSIKAHWAPEAHEYDKINEYMEYIKQNIM